MREMKDSGVPWIGEIPRGNRLLKVKYLVSLQKGKLPSETNVNEQGIPYIGASEMNGTIPKLYTTSDIPQCQPTDILLLWDGANAGLVSTGHAGAVSSTVCRIRNTSSLLSRYLYYTLKNAERYYRDKVNGTTIPHMSLDYINDTHVVDFKQEEQQRIADFLDAKCAEIDAIVEKTRTSIEEYKKLRQSVITEAVTEGIRGERPMKDSGVEWIGEIPAEWRLPKLGWITSKIGSGYTPKGGAEVYVSEGIKFLRSQNVYFEGFFLDDVAYITPEVDKEMSGTRVQIGDILFNITGGSIGRCRYVDENLGPANVNQHVCIVRPNKILTKYLFYFLQSNAGQTQVEVLQTGGNREGLSSSAFKTFNITLPSEDEQQEIAAYLDEKCASIDALIASKESLIAELESYKKSLIYEYVTGKKEVPA